MFFAALAVFITTPAVYILPSLAKKCQLLPLPSLFSQELLRSKNSVCTTLEVPCFDYKHPYL